LDLDPYQTEKQVLDPYQSEKQDPDPNNKDLDPEHWFRYSSKSGDIKISSIS
jgi:hypothetical protein